MTARCELTRDPGEFWRRAEPFLTADPVLYTVPLTLAVQRRDGTVRDPAPAGFAVVTEGSGEVAGFAMRTPPQPAIVSRMPEDALPRVVSAFRDAFPDLPGVRGTTAEAERFASLWCAGSERGYEVAMRQRIHLLDTLTPPGSVQGECRAATPSDEDLLAEWTMAFAAEADPSVSPDPDTARRDVALRLAERRAYLWTDGGEPVSYTGHQLPVAGVGRVGPVYTPVRHRGHGYASGLVAAVSRRLLDAGAGSVCLFTDLGNPTSNKIYARLGYRPYCDMTAYRFTG